MRRLNQDSKIEELAAVFQSYELDICAATETRLTGVDKLDLGNYVC